MKKVERIDTICNRAAALGCAESVQEEIERNYNFFREYLEMFPDQRMVEALRNASILGKIFVTGMEGDTVPTYQVYVLGVLKTLQKYDWDDHAQARLWRAGAEDEWCIAKAYTMSRSTQVVSPDGKTINVQLGAGEGYDGDHNDVWPSTMIGNTCAGVSRSAALGQRALWQRTRQPAKRQLSASLQLWKMSWGTLSTQPDTQPLSLLREIGEGFFYAKKCYPQNSNFLATATY